MDKGMEKLTSDYDCSTECENSFGSSGVDSHVERIYDSFEEERHLYVENLRQASRQHDI